MGVPEGHGCCLGPGFPVLPTPAALSSEPCVSDTRMLRRVFEGGVRPGVTRIQPRQAERPAYGRCVLSPAPAVKRFILCCAGKMFVSSPTAHPHHLFRRRESQHGDDGSFRVPPTCVYVMHSLRAIEIHLVEGQIITHRKENVLLTSLDARQHSLNSVKLGLGRRSTCVS